jgi:hypothetical protein
MLLTVDVMACYLLMRSILAPPPSGFVPGLDLSDLLAQGVAQRHGRIGLLFGRAPELEWYVLYPAAWPVTVGRVPDNNVLAFE